MLRRMERMSVRLLGRLCTKEKKIRNKKMEKMRMKSEEISLFMSAGDLSSIYNVISFISFMFRVFRDVYYFCHICSLNISIINGFKALGILVFRIFV